MAEEEKKYVVYGMRAKCSEGSMENYISTDVGHGVVYQGNPLLNANDHTPQVNLTHFGDCHSKLIYEEAKKQADEKYKADADDGFFSKAGKFIARNVTKAALTAKEYLGANKCELDTPLPWMFANEEHMIDGAPALTMESQCACRFGGVISIVPVEEEAETATEEETEDMAEDAEGTAAVNIMPAVAAIGFTMPKSPETSDEEGMEGPYAGVSKMLAEALKAGKKAAEEVDPKMYYIDKYVNEETLEKINPERWDCDEFKATYGDDVFEEMKEYMYKYGITDKTSILMFLSSIGDESNYGAQILQGDTKTVYDYDSYRKNLKEVPQIRSTTGIGLLQVTGDSQGYFIKDLYKLLKSSKEEKDKEAKETLLEYFNVSDEYFESIPESEPAELDNMAGFIYAYYPVESAMWYWGGFNTKCATFGADGTQENYSINDYIVKFNEANKDNLFLGMQYTVNTLPRKLDGSNERMSKEDVEGICNEINEIADENTTDITLENGEKYPMPRGWEVRRKDWNNARILLE